MMGSLTEEQSSVVTAHKTALQLVTAGPGTGKTHTLVARLSHLVEDEERPVFPGEVLALSFSRAAVNELRRRLRASGQDAGRIVPFTFDAFATRLLAQTDPGGSWTTATFDGRIEAATHHIGQIGEVLGEVQHIVVDELQDLVGVRMRFVRALIDELGVGFTLLGDPAQGIYDFSLADDFDPMVDGSPALYAWLREQFSGRLIERSLTKNHRARSDVARTAAALGPVVVDDPAAAGAELFEILRSAPGLLSWQRIADLPSRTAVLCRTNGEALWVSRTLRNAKVHHVLQRRAIDRAVAPWVARVARSVGPSVVTKPMLGEALGSLDGDRPEEVDLVWGPLKRIASSGNGVDMQRLVMRMREGVIPDELHVAQTAPITVSTVHRAKGLEFERVIVVPDGWRAPFDDDDARTLFVALSRTIDDLLQEQLPDVGGKLRKHQWLDRWLWTGWKHWQVRGLEVRPDDVHRVDPPGVGPGGGDPVEIQQALAEQVHPGDSVEIVLLRPKVDGGAIYQIKHAAGTIGLMADAFGREMQKIRRGQYPHRIAGVSVDSVRSVGGDASVSQQAGLGPAGAWLVPSLAGLGQFE